MSVEGWSSACPALPKLGGGWRTSCPCTQEEAEESDIRSQPELHIRFKATLESSLPTNLLNDIWMTTFLLQSAAEPRINKCCWI